MVSAAPKMVSFFTAVSWEKDNIFDAGETNFRPFLFWQGFRNLYFWNPARVSWDKGSFTNYVCKFCQLLTTYLPLFTLVDIWTATYLPVNVDMTDHPPTPCWHLLTFVQPPTSYLPRLVNVVCERPLIPFILSDKDLDGAEQSLRHFLDKFIQWHFHTSSKEVCLKKNSNYMQGLKSAILAIFQTGPGWPCPISTALKNPLLDFKKYFCFGFLWIPSSAGRQN